MPEGTKIVFTYGNPKAMVFIHGTTGFAVKNFIISAKKNLQFYHDTIFINKFEKSKEIIREIS